MTNAEREQNGWADYDPAKIPTKEDLSHIERWLATLSLPARVLDVGCGTGNVSRLLIAGGCSVVGIDINAAAIEALTREFDAVESAEFHLRDITSRFGFSLPHTRFDAAICQLVVSVVGNAPARIRLTRNIREALAPGGELVISFSGRSDDINSNYAELYATDFPHTHEYGSYFSRDEHGRILYRTHHFTTGEITALLTEQGFCEICIEEKIEASSRRPDQRARFFYVKCTAASFRAGESNTKSQAESDCAIPHCPASATGAKPSSGNS
jgi:SAM-dependent methyltransferase